MKTLLASLAVAATAAIPAAAVTSHDAAQVKIERYAPNVDVSTLSNAEIVTLLNVINSGDSNSDVGAKIERLVRAYQ
ncbi:hypothetical protein [Roseivivax sediminis]|uniref:Uncharacterized protein n=1 Tax=Roseivivax sediminis TaxID=936889 RepID=A0A1I2DQP9_9RHOB|nr:hypothetical protein [Roseivivax sediminis]SFE82828.1 hypothetical protein SAMN04515678_1184 [Roseivivax sediminis]